MVGVCLILFLVLISHGRKTIGLLSDLAYSASSLEKIAPSARRELEAPSFGPPVPMLLQGGYGYGNILRLCTPLPLERWLRPGLQSSRKRPACPLDQRLAAYDIVKTGDDSYRISIAVASFAQDDLDITFQSNLLTVTAKKQEASADSYLHRGIAGRPTGSSLPIMSG